MSCHSSSFDGEPTNSSSPQFRYCKSSFQFTLTTDLKLFLYLTVHYASNMHWGSGRIDPCFLVPATSCQFHAPPFYLLGNSPRNPLYRRLDGPQNWSGRYGEVKILDTSWNQTPISWTASPWPVAIPTALSRLTSTVTGTCNAFLKGNRTKESGYLR
jgi:hypothetical protein